MLLTLRQRIIFFICIAVFGFAISCLAGGFIINHFPPSTATMRIAAVIQSMFQLVIPAIVTAIILTRQAASFLAIDRKPNVKILLLSFAALAASIPAMNMIISINQNIELPESLHRLEELMKDMEAQAAGTITLLQGNGSIGDLIMNILIIGLLAGFGEELFFRGTFMRLMTTGGINHHVAIWTVAVIFSAMHLQFYGFVPRTLLGAYFGYLLVWSRCLWIPIMIHAANNIIYVCWQWAYHSTGEAMTPVDKIGTDGEPYSVIISIVITSVLITIIYKDRVKAL